MRIFGRRIVLVLTVSLMLAGSVFAMPDSLVPMGQAVGIKLDTDGVLVVGFTDENCPACRAGLKIGDRICCINGEELADAKSLQQTVANWDGEDLTLTVQGRTRTGEYAVCPEKTDKGYCLGLLVRDSTSGIGTITYYDPDTGRYGALGHGIMDQTGNLLPLQGGTLLNTKIISVQPSLSGTPGALQGLSASEVCIGTVDQNRASGIYGNLDVRKQKQEAIPLALPEEICIGPAQIRTTLQDSTVRCYEIQILQCFGQKNQGEKELVLQITDPALLAAAGGIVQGMSGSPILQNGKLVGAVTHVMVNDPAYGYGISIGTMLAGDRRMASSIP